MDAPTHKVMLVTGATDGIGKETALQLARAGAHVLLHGRNPERAERVAAEIRQATGAPVSTVLADLTSLAAVRRMADEVAVRFPSLSVLINNAGVFLHDRHTTEDGFETTFAVNHLAPYVLTRRLLPTLASNAPARILNVSSGVHSRGKIEFDDLQLALRYDGYTAYAQSKLANVLFTVALARRLDPQRVTANALHPGVIQTKLLREGFGSSGGGSLAEGAATSVFLATSDRVARTTGRYFVRGAEAPASFDEASVERLWEESERLCGRWLK